MQSYANQRHQLKEFLDMQVEEKRLRNKTERSRTLNTEMNMVANDIKQLMQTREEEQKINSMKKGYESEIVNLQYKAHQRYKSIERVRK